MKQRDIDAFFDAAKNGDNDKLGKLGNQAAAALSEEQKAKIEKAMSDPDFLSSLLSSEKAQEIIKKFHGGK